ncbi:hypothetical protein HHK36_032563 [Tetracentron sinense]|uniref:procollagen-proline 4-dioxygenase n=1 Tax=Tetracentron sinense TaxID=13715 RepID=A0A834Y6Y6_TETSI|nr:hypothetical protein HHK36_032563 [Tetracentron sinense]
MAPKGYSCIEAHGKIESSLGKGGDSGKVVTNTLLTGSVMPLDIDQDAIAARIEDRISAWTFLPKENGKSLQILHYGLEETKQHNNTFGDKSRVAFGELLVATIVLYLSNVTRGGEVVFPKSEFKKTQPRDDTLSDCAKTSYALRPMKGNALLFFSHHLNMTPDESSLHARCPVLEGEMWCATKFFHVREIDRREVSLESKSSECTDEDENCPRWATLGECQRNPVYMIGSPDYYGSCRKSCNAC